MGKGGGSAISMLLAVDFLFFARETYFIAILAE